jgi:hypothetical protein
MVGRIVGKEPLGRPRRRSEDNIKMDLQESMDWFGLSQDRDKWQTLVNAEMNLWVP